MSTPHAVLAPSSAARRIMCAGSREMEAKFPQEDSEESREGDAAHWVAAQFLHTQFNGRPLDWVLVGSAAPNGETVTEEMIAGATLYRDHIRPIVYESHTSDTGKRWPIIEEPIDISDIHPGCWGTPDCWFYINGALHIWDYKYGHAFVEVFENWQLIEYAAGILRKLQIDGHLDQATRIHFYIVQPRSFHRDGPIREWSTYACDLRGHFNQLRAAEAEAMKPGALCKPNPECNYCSARHACAALQQSALTAVDISKSNTPACLTAFETGTELRFMKQAAARLKARITGLEAEAEAMLRRGERVAYHELTETQTHRQWKVPADTVIAMGEMLGVDLAEPRKAISPAQAAKKGLADDVLKEFVQRPRGSMKLTESNLKEARKIFGKPIDDNVNKA